MISFSICKENDIQGLREFININWKKDHILYTSKELLEWQYKNIDGTYNFVLAKSNKDEILGILGFINNYRYDHNLIKQNITWLALWKVKKDRKYPALGLKMLAFLKHKFNPKFIAVIGINEIAKKIYSNLGYKIVELNHFYSTAENQEKKILDKSYSNHPKLSKKGVLLQEFNQKNFLKLDKIDFIKNKNASKSVKYFKNKYLDHPFYKYLIYLVNHNNCYGLISTRIDDLGFSKVLRIVDFIGEEKCLSGIGLGISSIMEKYKIEYVDFWNFGIDPKLLREAGFDVKNNNVLVPSRFEPYENKNQKLFCAYLNQNTNSEKFNFFKADGDQDRPNIIQ